MCGIFGVIAGSECKLKSTEIRKALNGIATISVNRGNDSSGIIFRNGQDKLSTVIKCDFPVNRLIRLAEYKTTLERSINAYKNGSGFNAMGHARLATNGTQRESENNQPVIKDDIVCVHNGIIVNHESLWTKYPELERKFDIDTEILLSLTAHFLQTSGDLVAAFRQAIAEIQGTVSCAMIFTARKETLLATNTGSLYYLRYKGAFVFASEYYFLTLLTRTLGWSSVDILHLTAGKALIVDPENAGLYEFDLRSGQADWQSSVSVDEKIEVISLNSFDNRELLVDPVSFSNNSSEGKFQSLLENNTRYINRLKRCTKCVLPETFPFIEFDSDGICNYCRNFKMKARVQTSVELKRIVDFHKRSDGKPDCLVPFSGGRDSTYALHYVKKELGLNPIAFTYDWGMVTDLARRNAARVCGKLGVENIIVAADIRMKRDNIRKNVEAWLKKPSLGMVPLFMAGDKYFFYYCNKLLRQNGLSISIWGSNPLENTDFKTGFAGAKPAFAKERIDDLAAGNKLRVGSFFMRNFISNPSYFNSSLIDTLGAYTSRYVLPRKGYLQLFDFIEWDETEIDSLIRNEYDWEMAVDSPSTWRIGDGTAAFYNYIYYTVAGFSEFDTFRSNQIRAGTLSREKALVLITAENQPRYENLRWYLSVVGLDFERTIRRINQIQKLYNVD